MANSWIRRNLPKRQRARIGSDPELSFAVTQGPNPGNKPYACDEAVFYENEHKRIDKLNAQRSNQ